MADLAGVNGTRKDFRGCRETESSRSIVLGTGNRRRKIRHRLCRSRYAPRQISQKPVCERAHQESVDTTKAKAIPGVVDIVTWEDEDIKKLSSGGGGFMRDRLRAFLDNHADQEGTEVGVIVVAENADICEEALRALDVEWEELPFVVDLRKGRASRTHRSSDRLPRQAKQAAEADSEDGRQATIPPKKEMSPIPTSMMAMSKKDSRKPTISSNMT